MNSKEMSDKVIVHIDLNAFFAQCEILQNPSLKGKAIAIGSSQKRSVISTASYEARKFGVNSAMPVTEALRLCPKLILVDPHFSLYQKYSKRFFGYLKNLYPILEQASIDECYIDMTKEIDKKVIRSYLFDLQMKLYRTVQLKCSIGCGKNKFLAKMGSDYKKPLGLTIIDDSNIKEILWPLSIEKMFGIGKKTAPGLISLGIKTIGDLARDDSIACKEFLGNQYQFYKDAANGIADDFVDSSTYIPKSCSSERTFGEDVYDTEELLAMLRNCINEVLEEVKYYDKKICSVSLKLRDGSFNTRSKRISLSQPSDDFNYIYLETYSLFENFYHGEGIRLIGFGAEKLIDKKSAKKDDESERLI